ncbi:MAG: hypothetical protein VB141_11550 [Burkholderia gladioli]
MRAFAYTVLYGTTIGLCLWLLPDVWREAHGFWNTVISMGICLFAMGMALGVSLWAVDIGLGIADTAEAMRRMQRSYTDYLPEGVNPDSPPRSAQRPFRTSPRTYRWIGRRSR